MKINLQRKCFNLINMLSLGDGDTVFLYYFLLNNSTIISKQCGKNGTTIGNGTHFEYCMHNTSRCRRRTYVLDYIMCIVYIT